MMTSSGNMIAIATLSTVTLVYLLRPKSKIGREKGRNERPVWRHNFAEILESETVLATILSLIVFNYGSHFQRDRKSVESETRN